MSFENKTFEKEIINIRRFIHQNPELSGKEYNTANFIEKKLEELKIPHKRLAKTGVAALLKGSLGQEKTVALRADIDALPLDEANGVPYKSVNKGVMHACGHDCHAAVMLGAAKLLNENKNNLKGGVKFIFQPAEEIAGGAKKMIKDGVLRNPKPDMILGAHICPWIKSGKVGIKYGAMMAAVDKFTVIVKGRVAHGAYPHLGKDAITAAAYFITSVQTVVSREIDPIDNAVVTIGKINGGAAYNIICDEISMVGTVRSVNKKARRAVKKSILNKLNGLESSFGVKCKIVYESYDAPLINSKEITEICHNSANEFYGKDNVIVLENPSMGGEDFASYLEEIPGNFMYIGSSNGAQTSYPWHHCSFNVDEKALPQAAKYIAYTVEKILNGK
ncbi:MAG: amidohydrolase [Endomicrobium sp.]|jgi:amidohydrolase|nr:amidohydrolase [Endomicrobium sp.]